MDMPKNRPRRFHIREPSERQNGNDGQKTSEKDQFRKKARFAHQEDHLRIIPNLSDFPRISIVVLISAQGQ
jgi:hypothetical protein